MRKLISAVLVFTFLTSFYFLSKENNDKMGEFNWLSGSWTMVTKRGVIIESWTTTNDSSMQGRSSFIKNQNDTSLLETISLVYRNKNYYYIPVAARQNDNKPVSFIITSFGGKGFVAENPEHDFPKRITYNLINKDSIHAFIDDGKDMPEKRGDFYYLRVKN